MNSRSDYWRRKFLENSSRIDRNCHWDDTHYLL